MHMNTHTHVRCGNKNIENAAGAERHTQTLMDKNKNTQMKLWTHTHMHAHTRGGLVHDSVIDGEK